MVTGRGRPRESGLAEAQAAFSAATTGPVVLLAGPERLYAEELIDLLVDKLVPADFRPFNYNRYRGGEDPVDAVINAAGTLPMFAERRVVALWDGDGMSRAEMEPLAEYIAHPSPSTVLVVTASETGERVPAALRRIPERYTLWRPFPRDAMSWAIRRARRSAKELPASVAEELFALCSGHSGDGRAALSDLAVEVEKLCLLVGERNRIESEDLRVVGRHAEARVLYQIEAAVAERSLPLALGAVEAALLFPRENGVVRIVAMLGERFRRMLVASDRMHAGLTGPAVVAGMWFVGGPSATATFLKSVGLYSRSELAAAIEELARLDRALKTGQAEPNRLHLEAALHRILVPRAFQSAGAAR